MDTLISLLNAMEPQHWLVLGLILLIAEMATGTTYLLWPAVAAFLTAAIAFIAPTGWLVEVGIFAVLVMVLTYFGQPLVRQWRREGPATGLNDRAATLIGRPGVVESFANGAGQVRVGDTNWRAVSDDTLEPGAAVQIVAVDGITLKVKRA